jgi:hypothetical protein
VHLSKSPPVCLHARVCLSHTACIKNCALLHTALCLSGTLQPAHLTRGVLQTDECRQVQIAEMLADLQIHPCGKYSHAQPSEESCAEEHLHRSSFCWHCERVSSPPIPVDRRSSREHRRLFRHLDASPTRVKGFDVDSSQSPRPTAQVCCQ